MPLVLRAVKGSELTISELDGNFTYLDGRIDDLEALIGKSIDSIEYSASSITFHLSDSTSVIVPLPSLQLVPRGEWMPSTAYSYGDIFNVHGIGLFFVLAAHTSASTFDPDATDNTTENNPVYQLWAPLRDVYLDIIINPTGTVPDDQRVLACLKMAREVRLPASLTGSYFSLLTATQNTTLVFSLQKNNTAIGTVTFAPGVNVAGDGSQDGTVAFASDVDFEAGDYLIVKAPSTADVPMTDGTEAENFSATIVATRLDI